MTQVTAEGHPVYPVDCGIRQAIPEQSMCKTCRHLGDLCRSADREFAKISDKASTVVYCGSFQKYES